MGKRKEKLSRAVLDTNVLISALLFEGISTRLVNIWQEGGFIPLLGKEILLEVIKVLSYPKFSLNESEIMLIVTDEIIPFFEVVDINEVITGVCNDPDDDKFISCAVNGNADFIVTGDIDLLKVGKYRNIHIMNVREFMEMLDRIVAY